MVDDKNYNHNEIDEGFTLVDFFNYLRKNFLILFGFVFTFLVLGVVYTWFLVTPMYTSKTSISFNIERSNNYATTYAYLRNLLPTQEELLKREDFLKMVIEKAKEEETPITLSVAGIAKNLTVSVNNEKLIVYITVKNTNPNQAYIIAKTLADLAVEEIDYSQEDAHTVVNTFIVNYPKVPQAPSSPNRMLNIIISLMVGGISAIIVILLKEQFSSHFRSTEEIEKFTRYPILGEIYELSAKEGKED